MMITPSLISETPAFTQRHQLAVSVYGQRAPRRMAYNFDRDESRPKFITRKQREEITRRRDRTWRREEPEITYISAKEAVAPFEKKQELNTKHMAVQQKAQGQGQEQLQGQVQERPLLQPHAKRMIPRTLSISSNESIDSPTRSICSTPTISICTTPSTSSSQSTCSSPMSTMSIASEPSITSEPSSPPVMRIYPAYLPTPDVMDLSTVTPQRRRLLVNEILISSTSSSSSSSPSSIVSRSPSSSGERLSARSISPAHQKPSVHDLLRATARPIRPTVTISESTSVPTPAAAVITYDATSA